MMDPAVKTALALCVLLMGLCAGMLFRRDKPATVPEGPTTEDALLRFRSDVSGTAQLVQDRLRGSAAASAKGLPSTRPAMVVTPLAAREPPPSLAADYPTPAGPASSRWGVSMEMMLPAADVAAHSHKIVDGDTLPGLARRYLGSADRAHEIFELNRDVLRDPELLPIGAELKLPPR